jgi:LPS export ABC transporter protein LptC
MTRWQRRARLLIAVLGLVVTAAVVLAIRRGERPSTRVNVERVDPTSVAESTKGVLTQTKGAAENFNVAFERQLTYEGGESRLEGVRIQVNQRGGRDFTVTSRQGHVGDDQASILLEGRVKMVASDGLIANAGKATYNDTEGIVRAPGPVTFERERLSGSGTGMTYDKNLDEMTLLEDSIVRMKPDETGGGALEIRSSTSAVNRQERYMLFEGGVTIVRDNQTTKADEATAYLAEDSDRITAIDLRGGASVETDKPATGALKQMAGQDITLVYAETGNLLQHVTLGSGAVIEMAGTANARGTRIGGDAMEIQFGPDGTTVVTLNAREQVLADFAAERGTPARRVRAQVLDSFGEPPGGLETARFSRNVEFVEVIPGKPPVTRTVRAQSLEAAMKAGMAEIDDARFSGNVRFEEGALTGTGQTVRYQVAAGVIHLATVPGSPRPRVIDDEITVEADTIEMTLENRRMKALTDVRSVLKNSEDRQAARRKGGAARLPGMLTPNQPVNVTSAALDYQEAAGHAVYTGGARLWQSDTTILGESITIDDVKGDLMAAGNVRSSWSVEEVNKDTNEIEKIPTIATAAEMHYEDALRRATYTTNAHVNGTQGDLTGRKIELYLKEASKEMERVEAYDDVTVRLEVRTGTGARLTYFSADERYLMRGTPVRIVEECRLTTGKTLTFFRSTDRIMVDGNEEIRTQTKSGGGCPGPPLN